MDIVYVLVDLGGYRNIVDYETSPKTQPQHSQQKLK